MEIKSRTEFITRIFEFFRVTDDNKNLFRTYDLALSVKYQVNWHEFYTYIIKTAEKRVLPVPKFFVDKLPSYEVRSIQAVRDEGSTLRVVFDDDRFTDFVVCSFGTDLNDLKKRMEYTDSSGVKRSRIKKMIKYPKEATLIGWNVYWNYTIPNEKNMTPAERDLYIKKKDLELESQIKTLWVGTEI